MILIISTTLRNEIELGLFDQKTRLASANDSEPRRIEMFQYETDDQSRDLLIKINELLGDKKLSFSDIKAIAVNRGPGSFTGVRVGITTANTLAWSLNIPIVGYKDGELENGLPEIIEQKFSKIVLPFYPTKN